MTYPFEISDINQLMPLTPDGWSPLQPHFEFYTNSNYCQPIKFLLAKEMVAVGSIIYHKQTAWLAHVIVHPAYRNQGLGAKMTKTLVDLIDRSHYSSINLIATDLGFPIYLKAGFKVSGIYNHLKRNESQLATPPICDRIIPYKPQFADEIFLLDLFITGENRANFIRDHLSSSFAWVSNRKIQGVFFPTLGDGFIIAMNEQAGADLLIKRNQLFNYAILPSENKAGLAQLTNLGFNVTSTSRRMSLGQVIHWKPTQVYNRISGQIG